MNVLLLLESVRLIGGAVSFPSLEAPSGNGCPIYILEREATGFTVRSEIIEDGSSRAFVHGKGSAFLTLILAHSAGTAGNVLQESTPHALMVRCRAEAIETIVQPRGGEARPQPAVSVASQARLRLRVNVIGADGSRAVFVIDPGGVISRDTIGPVVDMFRGMVPLTPGDVSVTTEAREVKPPSMIRGTASLTLGGPWFLARVRIPGGGEGDAIVDLGASRTLLARDMLPPGIVPQPLVAVEHGPLGSRERAGSVEAAGGSVAGAGRASLPVLEVNGIHFDSVSVNIVPSFPSLAGLKLAGVIGIDLLSRTDIARLEKNTAGVRLVMGGAKREEPHLEVPFSSGGGLILIPASIGDQKLSLILDTGARGTVLSEAAAIGARLARAVGEPETFRGLDGQPTEAWPTNISELRIGNGALRDFRAHVGALPVLTNFGAIGEVGLLGQNLWERFSAIEVDWVEQTVRFYQ